MRTTSSTTDTGHKQNLYKYESNTNGDITRFYFFVTRKLLNQIMAHAGLWLHFFWKQAWRLDLLSYMPEIGINFCWILCQPVQMSVFDDLTD